MKYPPFCDIIVIGISGEKLNEVQKTSNVLYSKLGENIKRKKADLAVYTPRPAPIDKIKNRYRFRIILKGTSNDVANRAIQEVLEESYQKGMKTRIVVDINPSSMM